jgi:hypothetical protein
VRFSLKVHPTFFRLDINSKKYILHLCFYVLMLEEPKQLSLYSELFFQSQIILKNSKKSTVSIYVGNPKGSVKTHAQKQEKG